MHAVHNTQLFLIQPDWVNLSKTFQKYPDKEIKDIFCLNSHLGPLQFVALSL